jgi:hypothetical protein
MTDYSAPSNAEIKKGGAIPPLSHESLWRGAYLSKHRDNIICDHVRKYLKYDNSYTTVSTNIILYMGEPVNRSQMELKQL